MSSDLLEKGYEPAEVEKLWYEFWQKEGLFAAKDQSENKSFSIVIPPPNVTGVLHMGHALNNTMQDILCRYRRSKGDNVLWMPGTDHAGIATQNVVEKHIAEKGKKRQDLGREKFIEAVWKWREESGSAIINQLKRLGASCDWDRERFTMDEGLSRAVRKVFVTLYNQGMIYRGNYITNWCPRCNTALSDLEVEHADIPGHLYHISYPLVDGSRSLVVATTRPETMLGDTAVAVNPDDERYHDLTCDKVLLPLTDRMIPVIRDSYVDVSFGTGALKVTPAHDPNDFDLGGRHKLETIKVIGEDGKMLPAAGDFQGMDRFECRKKVVEALEDQGFLVKIEDHEHAVGQCYRCKTIVEPNLSKQWFVKTADLAEKAIEAVKEGKTRIIPESWTKTYFEWMNNIRDWCVSRQIWWGHRIPVWTCGGCGKVMVEMETPKKCSECNGSDLTQETDVLDTWFSSALWPFSTMGWPDETPLLKTFYPTSVLITGFDILFFWVARMMMMGLHFMGEVPFRDVYVHALVRDEHGKKMSKSKGNVIDPLKVIDKYGTDAFRFTLAAFAAQGRDIKLSEDRIEGYRHFINKIWNAARFSLMHIKDGEGKLDPENMSLADKWILSRLIQVTGSVEEALDDYRFNEASGYLYKFVWHEVCDWYLEAVKPVLFDKKGQDAKKATTAVLWRVLRETLVLLHPFVPFVTEEIWHRLPGVEGSIMKASFPSFDDLDGIKTSLDDAGESMAVAMEIIVGIRNIRGEMNIPFSKELEASVHFHSDLVDKIQHHFDMISNFAKLKSFSIRESEERPESAATAVIKGGMVFVSLEGVVDFTKEEMRLEKGLAKVTKEMAGLGKKLENESFLEKAPDEVVDKVRKNHQALGEKSQKLTSNLEMIRKFMKK